jgi:hypothetical protein
LHSHGVFTDPDRMAEYECPEMWGLEIGVDMQRAFMKHIILTAWMFGSLAALHAAPETQLAKPPPPNPINSR